MLGLFRGKIGPRSEAGYQFEFSVQQHQRFKHQKRCSKIPPKSSRDYPRTPTPSNPGSECVVRSNRSFSRLNLPWRDRVDGEARVVSYAGEKPIGLLVPSENSMWIVSGMMAALLGQESPIIAVSQSSLKTLSDFIGEHLISAAQMHLPRNTPLSELEASLAVHQV